MTIRKTNIVLNLCLCAGVAAIFCCFMLFARAAANIDSTLVNKEICLSLGNELRESSKDLTRHVRMYAASGDGRFESAYQETLDERDGKIPRSRLREYFPNEKHALLDLLKRYGISREELGYIEEANRLSNRLVPLEVEAMNAMKGLFKDAQGNYTVRGKPDRERAIALVYGPEYDEYTAPIMLNMDRFASALLNRLNGVVAGAEREKRISQAVFVGSVALMLGLILFSMLYTNRTIIRPILRTTSFAGELASGAFSRRIEVKTGNEIGQLRTALNSMADQIEEHISEARTEADNARLQSEKAREAMEQAHAATAEARGKTETMLRVADSLASAGGVISNATSELSTRLGQSDRNARITAQRLSEAASAMQEMNVTVREVARSASEASRASLRTREKAQQGAAIVENSLRSIDRASGLSRQLKEDMAQLAGHTQSISQVMGVILDIADQTNLLALNAAIEAARAGESGRGFAVVADEVRKLAEKTMASTTDVSNILNAIQESARKSGESVDSAAEEILQANALASQSGTALRDIVDTVDTVSDQIQAIAAASEEQSASSEQINSSIAEVNSMGGSTAEAMHEAAKVVSGLAAQAEELTGMISELRAI